jgi:phosphoribosyl-AMP cyclohydrolase
MMKISKPQAQRFLKSLNFKEGLVTAVVREFKSGDVLMVAHMNEEAVVKTLTTGLMHYWSRSRNKLWFKGEQSKNFQRVRNVFVDCDCDALLFDVEQTGGACHDGYRSCFYRKVKGSKSVPVMKKMFNPKEVYK